MTYQIWQLAVSYGPQLRVEVCKRASWYTVFMFVLCTFLAQAAITLRIYAVTGKSIRTAIGFATISASQLGLGIYIISVTGREGGLTPPAIPFDAYRLCLFARHRSAEIATITLSLFYDFLAFLVIIFVAVTSGARGLRISSILRTIAEDATRYFLVIFTIHLVLEMTENLARESIQVLPGVGIVVFLPVMASRIMLSLRKAADKQQNGWAPSEPSTTSFKVKSMKFFRPRGGQSRGQDDIPLESLPESQV